MIAPLLLANSLTYLTETAMIRRADGAEPAYMIKHALVQDMAQATLLKNASKRLHLLVGVALENVNAERLDDYAAELAFHFAQAEDETKALEYSIRAGDVAARIYANAEALEHYGRAIEIARRGIATPQQIVELYTRRGRILEVTGKYHEALASYEELYELAKERGDRSLELASLMLRAPVYSGPLPTFDATLAKQLLLDALGTARELRDEPAEARVLWILTLLSVQTMQPGDGLMYGELALAICEKLDLREQHAYTLHELFVPYRATGQLARAREAQAQARDLFRETRNLAMLADNLGMSAQATLYEGALSDAAAYATEGLAISRMIDNPFGIVFNSLFLTLAHLERGEHAPALEEIRERNQLMKNSLSALNLAWVAAIHAWFLRLIGASELSAQMESMARTSRNASTSPVFRTGQIGLLARTRLLAHDLDGAAAELERGAADYDMGNMLHPGAIHIPLAMAELGLAQGESARVLADLALQAEWARANEFQLVLAENLLLQGRAHLGLGDAPGALAVLQEACKLVETIGSRRLQFQVLAATSLAEQLGGNLAQSAESKAHARAVVESIVERTPPEYRAGFLSVAAVTEVMN